MGPESSTGVSVMARVSKLSLGVRRVRFSNATRLEAMGRGDGIGGEMMGFLGGHICGVRDRLWRFIIFFLSLDVSGLSNNGQSRRTKEPWKTPALGPG